MSVCVLSPILFLVEEFYSVESSLLLGNAFLVFWEESDVKNLNLDLNFPKVSEKSHSSTIQENFKIFNFIISFVSEFLQYMLCVAILDPV